MGNKQTITRNIDPQFVRELGNHIEKSWDMTAESGGVSNELWSSETKAFLDNSTLKSLFFSEDWVFIIIDLIAAKISSQPLRVMTKVVEGSSESVQPVPDHPLNALLEQPNEWQDYSQWMYNTATELFLMGNAVIWHAPQSGQMITLPTETISLEFDSKGVVSGYSMMTYAEEMGLRELVSRQSFNPKTICHVRRPNPSSLLWGLSPFIPGRKSVLFNRYSTDYLNAFYLKQATPGLALSLDRTVNEDVALRQLRSFEVAYQGRKNQRRTLILPKGVTATTLTHSLSDQKLLEHIQSNRETICGLLKVPKHELSVQTAGSLGSEEYKIAIRNFWESTLKPGMGFIAGSLTKFFQKELGEDAFLMFDLSGVAALSDDLLKMASTAKEMLQAGLSVNEVRQKVWNQKPSEVAGSYDPYVLVKPTTAPLTFSAPLAANPFPASETQSIAPSSTKITITPAVEEFRANFVKQLDEDQDKTISDMIKGAVDTLVGMTEEAVNVIRDSDKSILDMCAKALPPKRLLERSIRSALASKFEEVWQGLIARTLRKTVDVGYGQMLQAVFNDKDRESIEALKARDEKKRRIILEARGLESFDQISKSHTERIMKQVTDGLVAGDSITGIIRRVASALGTPKDLRGRAETIARTETLTAISIGQAAAVENAREVIPGLKKAWLTAGDNRVRDSHDGLHGDVVDADEKFDNGLRHPRDIESTDPAEVINCRCTLILIPPGEKLEIPK